MLRPELRVDSGTLTPLLKRMETAGLLLCQRSNEDERRVHVYLSPAGKRLQAKAAHIPGSLVDQCGLPLNELMALNQQIKSLRTSMQATPPQPAP